MIRHTLKILRFSHVKVRGYIWPFFNVIHESFKIINCFLFQKREFTDVSGFALLCLICNTPLKGQSQAQEHAKSTGHMNFGEV